MNELRPRSRAPQASGIARHGRLKRRSAIATVAKVLVAVVGVLVVSGVSVAALATWDLVKDAKPSVKLVGKTPGPVPDIGAIPGGVNLLLVGTDTRTGQGGGFGDESDSEGYGQADVTMMLHIAEDHKSATVVSFPRDLMIPIPSCPDPEGGSYSSMSKQQFNSSLGYGGLPCTVLTVEKLTDVSIPFAGMITFEGVIAMSNVIGGVPVCIAEGIHDPYTGLDLDAGEHTLQGLEALQFVRTRHGVGNGGDLTRISNQQVFMSSLVRSIKSAGTLTNPAKVWGLAKATVSNTTLSESLDNVTTLYQIAMALKDIDLDKVMFVQYPTFADPDNRNRVVPDWDSADILFEAIKADKPIRITGGTGGGSVGPDGQPLTPAPTDSAAPAPDASAPDASIPSASVPPASDPAVELPSNIHGQSAALQTCSKGQG